MGIIKTFEMIGIYGTGDANRLAGGISEALVTTEMGLIVAIPALIWHAVLNRRLRKIVSNLEKAMLSFINALSMEGKPDAIFDRINRLLAKCRLVKSLLLLLSSSLLVLAYKSVCQTSAKFL